MRSLALRALSLSAALSVGAALLIAQPPARTPDQSPRRGAEQGAARRAGGPVFRDITLTEAQQTRVREIQQRYVQERRTLAQTARDRRPADGARPQAAQRQRADSATRAQWRTEREQVRARMQQLTERQHADLRAVLTGAQQTTFDRNVTELRQRMTARGAGRGERGLRGSGAARGGKDGAMRRDGMRRDGVRGGLRDGTRGS